MRLERLLTHRIIQLSRIVLPVVVIVLIAIPGWNFYARRVRKADSPRPAAKLPIGVSVRTDGFTYSRTEGGRTQFTVNAKQTLGYQDDKYILQDVVVTVYGEKEGEPVRTIRGENCTYDQVSNDFTCNGHIEVQLDEATLLRTEKLIYSHRDGLVNAPQRATIERAGATGSADTLEYNINNGLLKLIGAVRIQSPDQVEVETGSALFQQKENWSTMSGGVFIKSPTGWIRGSTGRADLEPQTYTPKVVTVEGNVMAESQAQAGREVWKIRADWLEATLSKAGTTERVKTRGNVDIEKSAGDARQGLTGGEVEATFKDGRVHELEARDKPRMTFGADQTLESSQISTTATGSVRTSDNSVLRVGDSTIEGREFLIENAENTVTFDTLRRAILKKEGGQESSSDQTRARFDSRTNQLIELVQRGNFRFSTPQYNGRAETGRFEEGGTVITLEGSPVVNDFEKRLEAAEIRINQKNNSFIATNNVSTFIRNPKDPVLVKAARAEGGADSVLYTGEVQLWRGQAYIKAGRLNASGRGEQDMKVHAEAAPGGRVQSNLQNVRATSETLDYDGSRGVIRYLGRVRAQKQDMLLETPDMTVNFRGNELKEIVASGGVAVTRADQRATGEKAVYDAATDVMTLTGRNVQVRDKERLTQGSSVIIRNRGQSVTVEGQGEPTITRHPVKTAK